MRYYRSIILGLCLSGALCARAQMTKAKLESLLTNENSRDWQFLEYNPTMGDKCKGSGQLFTFQTGGQLDWNQCAGGKLEHRRLTWSVNQIAPGEFEMSFGETITLPDIPSLKTFRIDIPLGKQRKAGQKMIWRVVPARSADPEDRITLTSLN